MLTSKQRAHLRSIAQSYNTIFFVGKLGIGDELVKQLDDVLNCRELIKVGVQENCEFTAREAGDRQEVRALPPQQGSQEAGDRA